MKKLSKAQTKCLKWVNDKGRTELNVPKWNTFAALYRLGLIKNGGHLMYVLTEEGHKYV